MRTLQEKYNGIQEGTFSKDHFLAEARMQQPQLITRFNGYDDAVQILKNRGMIQEAKKEEVQVTEASYKTSSNSKEAQHLKKGDIIGSGDEVVSVSAGAKTPAGKVEVTLKTKSGSTKTSTWGKTTKVGVRPVTEAKQPKATKKGLTDYRYKPTNEMDKYPYEQILRGIRVELETLGVQGTPTAEEYAKALAKVSKNLAKDSIFYTNLVAGVNPRVDLHDKMIPVTAKNTVDTFNGMKKAALKEGFKKLIKKVLSESMGDFVGDKERAERSANYGQPGENEYEFYSDPENYNEEDSEEFNPDTTGADPRDWEKEDEFELHGEEDEEDLDESAMGDVYQIAQESDTFEDFVQAIEQEYGPTSDVDELMYIWDNRRDLEDDLYEVRKAKSLSELLK